MRGAVALGAWIALLAATLAVLHDLGARALTLPPPSDPNAWSAWASTRDPLLVVAAIGRSVALGLGWYLALTTMLGVTARMSRAVRLVRLTDALTVPFVRGLLQRALGIGLATVVAGAALPAPPAAGDRSGDRPPALVDLERSGGELIPADAPGPSLPPALDLLGRPDVPTVERVDPADDRGPVHEVRSGESFWSIAADTLAAAWGRAPTDGEVVPYWRELIDANRDRLVDPDDPDLIHPAQRFRLPPAPPGPT